MDAHDRVEAGRDFESDREYTIRHAVKVIDAAVTHEGFEANYPPLVEDLEVVEVVGDKTAPQAEVHQRFLRGDCKLLIEGGRRRGRRVGVERHLEDSSDAASRRPARAGFPALPGGAAGLIEVNVGVYDAGQDHEPGCIDGVAFVTDLSADC